MSVVIRDAQEGDLEALGALFDQYRQFYELPPDILGASAYITERYSTGTSVLLIAAEHGKLLGFVQMYPTWCSLLAAPIYVLYDLFVAEDGRRRGVGRELMLASARRAKDDGKRRLDLSTAKSNARAQGLYESLGWERDNDYFTYTYLVR